MRARSSLLFLSAALGLIALHAPAHAGVPSAANSTVAMCLTACPLGDMGFAITVRDLANNPIENGTVIVDFSSCPEAFICTTPGMAPDPYLLNIGARTMRMFTNAAGQVTFPLRVGGLCAPGTVRVYADGVLIAQRGLASPDQNGNGVAVAIVDVDFDIALTKLGTNDPTADFDCDGDVDDDDLYVILGNHLSHACEGFVDPAKRSTWGRVKSHYR